jgi:tungstate transport system permease protein
MFTLDVWEIVWLSLKVTTTAIGIGMLIGIPCGAFLGLYSFPGKRLLVVLIYTCMGLPPVLVGVIVYLLLSRFGPLGSLGLLFTPQAMTIAQVALVTPILTGLTMAAVREKERVYWETAKSLGASPVQMIATIVREAQRGIWSGVAAAYGRAISEVGAVMLVGGNIEHHTRVMTTAIILETRMGNFSAALHLGLVLLAISFLFNSFLMAGTLNQWKTRRR